MIRGRLLMTFRLKTVLGIALIEGVLLMLLVYTSVDYLKSSNQAEIEKRARSIVLLFAAAAKDAVISTDVSTLQELSNELLDNTQVLYVEIYDRNDLLVRAGEQVLTSASVQKLTGLASGVLDKQDSLSPHKEALSKAGASFIGIEDGVLDVQADIIESGFMFGRVELGISTNEFDQFLASATTRFSSIAGLEMLLVALFSWLLGSYLTKNLSELKRASKRILKGETGVQIPVNTDDEIGQTTRAFNRMIEKIEMNTHELESANIRLSTILEAAVDGFIIIDTQGLIVQVNPAVGQLFGYDNNDLIGHNVSIFMPSHERHMQHDFLMRFINSKRGVLQGRGRELVAQHKNGKLFPIDLSVSKMLIDGDIMLLGLVKDLSDIKRKEAEAKRTESILLATLEASQDALITIDITGRIQEFNEAASHLFGHSREQALGEILEDLIFVDIEKKAFKEGLETFRKTGCGPAIKKSVELMSIRADGTNFPVEMKMIPVQLGDEILLTAFLHDVSERMQYETELKQAKKQAELGSKAKSRFLATMSHEIRSPLNAVLGGVELMLDSKLNKDQRIYAHTAKEAGTALLSTINDILDFSKIEAGQMVLENMSFSPAKMVAQVMQILAPKANEKGVNLATFINRNVPELVKGDAQRLRQVLHNLVDNAIKFSSGGCVSVEMWIPDSHHQEVQLHCAVTDEGIGISLPAQKKLFKEFSQVHDQHNTNYKGTGLGLAICSELIIMMGGEIELSSRLGHGSCFRFNVRLQLEEQRGTCLTHIPAHARVLLVHPDKTFSHLVRKQYSQYGVQTVNVSQVTDIFKIEDVKGRFNLILIDDTSLSQLSLNLSNQFKRDFLFEDGLIAALMSGLSPEMPVVLADIGLEQVINKPLSREMLLGLLSGASPDELDISEVETLLPELTLRNKRLLLAEDSPSNRVIAGAMLAKSGFEVEFAHNGKEAVKMSAEHDYGLILMDMRMPEMDGVEATRAILLAQPDTVILAMTANVSKEDVESCLNAGMKDFVAKPVNQVELVKAINNWLPCLEELDLQSKQSLSKETVLKETVLKETVLKEISTDKSCEVGVQELSLIKESTIDDIMNAKTDNPQKIDKQAVIGDRLFDELVLSDLVDALGKESMKGMFNVYLQETYDRLKTLESLKLSMNFNEIDDQAHTLKSSSGSFGAQALYEVAKCLEKSARDKDQKEVESYMLEVQEIGEQTIKAFRERFAA
ncbi:sensory box histidine kinase/response regulator [Shewanella violacea DSS12]|uniref:histidine kinase n=2 Tax=Shewanella violacea TaxID=60217 RepID=D4ZII7_SHEVD|nr:sensory box histidine kinase/response regulator [Shewanella violacea DSS12]